MPVIFDRDVALKNSHSDILHIPNFFILKTHISQKCIYRFFQHNSEARISPKLCYQNLPRPSIERCNQWPV